MDGKYRNDIPVLTSLTEYKFENIFKVYQNSEGYYYYNILKKISIPADISVDLYENVRINRKLPLTAISYTQYNTIDLWWLICIINNMHNPLELIAPGTVLKVIKPSSVPDIIDAIKSQL
jgi:hypothetical protein